MNIQTQFRFESKKKNFIYLCELQNIMFYFLSGCRHPGRTVRHVYGRIRQKYGNFRPGNGDHMRCTVLRFDYGIIRRRIRCSYTVLRKGAVFGRRIRAVTTLYLRHTIKVSKIHN